MKALALTLTTASALLCAATAGAQSSLTALLTEEHRALGQYDYAELQHAVDADDFDGFEVLGSTVIRPNVALIGRLGRLSGSLDSSNDGRRAVGGISGAADGVSTTVEVGARYFRQFDRVPDADVNLSASLVNQRHELEGRASGRAVSSSDSDTFLQLGSQLRRVFEQPLAGGRATFSEGYIGALAALNSGASVAGQAGVVLDFNPRISGKAEVLLDDGANLRVGVRMALGQLVSTPLFGAAPAAAEEPAAAPVPQAAALRHEPGDAELMRAVEEFDMEDYGLSADELADIEDALGFGGGSDD